MTDTDLGVIDLFLMALGFMLSGFFWAAGLYEDSLLLMAGALTLLVVVVISAFLMLDVAKRLQQRLDRVIPVREYEVRHEHGSRVLVAYLRGGEQ